MSEVKTTFSYKDSKYIFGQGRISVGERYGSLTAVKFIGIKNGHALWRFKCDCGENFRTLATYVKSKNVRFCKTCQRRYRNPINVKHGYFGTYTYNSWAAMMQRCNNPKNHKFYRYGGRGIKVCERWLKFDNFLEDMGEKPGKGYSIERKNNDGNYEPGNCKWATNVEQAKNRSSNVNLHFRGKDYILADLSKEFKMNVDRLRYLVKRGVPLEFIFANKDKKKIDFREIKPKKGK